MNIKLPFNKRQKVSLYYLKSKIKIRTVECKKEINLCAIYFN